MLPVYSQFNIMCRTSQNIDNRFKFEGKMKSDLAHHRLTKIVSLKDMHPEWKLALQATNEAMRGTSKQVALTSLFDTLETPKEVIFPDEPFKANESRLGYRSSLFKFCMKRVAFDYKIKQFINWTNKHEEYLYDDLATFFNDCLYDTYVVPGCLDVFIECVLAFAKSTTYKLRLEILGPMLPFLLAYLNAKHTGEIDVGYLGILYLKDNRILTYKTADSVLCYGLDCHNHQFVLVGALSLETPSKPRIAYFNELVIESPTFISLAQQDYTRDQSAVLYNAYRNYMGCRLGQVIDLVGIPSDSDMDDIHSTLSFDDHSFSGGAGGASSANSAEALDQAIADMFAEPEPIKQVEFVEYVLKLKTDFCAEACVQQGDCVNRFGVCGEQLFADMNGWRSLFIVTCDHAIAEDKILFHKADFLQHLVHFATNADSLLLVEHYCAKLPEFEDLINLAKAKHDAMVEQGFLDACRAVASVTTLTSLFIEACRQQVANYKAKVFTEVAVVDRLQTALDDCITRRHSLFHEMQACYDERISVVRQLRDILRQSLHCQSQSQSTLGAMDTADA